MGLPDQGGLEAVTPTSPADKETFFAAKSSSAPEVRHRYGQSDSTKEVYFPPPSHPDPAYHSDETRSPGPPAYYGEQVKLDAMSDTRQIVSPQRPSNDTENGAPGGAKGATICGMKRKVFWLVLVIAIIAVVGIAVGIGVGVSASNTTDDGNASAPSSTASPDSAAAHAGISKDSKLASISWTASGLTYARVYYQDSKGVINEAGWTSSTKTWKVKAITVPSNMLDSSGHALDSGTTIDVKSGTPITASVFNTEEDGFGISLYFLTSGNKIRQLDSKTPSGPWKSGSSDEVYSTSEDSQLSAVWLDKCTECDAHDAALVFQVANGEIQMWNRFKTGNLAIGMPKPNPVDGSAIAMAPVAVDGVDRNARLFMVSGGALTILQLVPSGANGGWSLSAKGVEKLDASAQLASMSYGSTSSGSSEYLQVFSTNPTSGGISSWRAFLSGGQASWGEVAMPDSMGTVASFSTIAANQAQMVFALRETNGKIELVRWQMNDGKQAQAQEDTVL